MIPYASRTGTRRNLDALRAHGWRLLVSAAGELRAEGFRYALDNGAWSAHTQGRPFDVEAFELAVATMGAGADWIVAPDIVGKGYASLRLSERWLPDLVPITTVLIPVQDGVEPRDLEHVVGPRVGVFVGGDPGTDWKERTAPAWGELGRERGCHVHVGRVNSVRRINLIAAAGAHSFDGTAVTRYAVNIRKLDGAVRQSRFRW